jgi:hypothetical protein
VLFQIWRENRSSSSEEVSTYCDCRSDMYSRATKRDHAQQNELPSIYSGQFLISCLEPHLLSYKLKQRQIQICQRNIITAVKPTNTASSTLPPATQVRLGRPSISAEAPLILSLLTLLLTCTDPSLETVLIIPGNVVLLRGLFVRSFVFLDILWIFCGYFVDILWVVVEYGNLTLIDPKYCQFHIVSLLSIYLLLRPNF